MYHYAANNPVRYTDPDGQWIDTFLDIMGVAADIVEIAANPVNPWAWASLAADVGCVFIPGATGGGKLIQGAEIAVKASRTAKVVGKADNFVDAVKAGERILGKYSDLQKVTRGYNHAIEAHHIIPQFFGKQLKKNVGDFASVVLDKTVHKKYTDAWRPFLKKLENLEGKELKSALLNAAEEIYKDAPDLLKAAKDWLKTF